MGVQMNIKNPEAYAIAAELSEQDGVSLTQAVLEALRGEKARRKAAIDKKVQEIMEYCRETRAMMSPELLAFDMNDYLYDEYGLPK